MHLLVGWVGWRNAILVFASVELFVAVPLIWNACQRADQYGSGSTPCDEPSRRSCIGRAEIAALLAPCRMRFAVANFEHTSLLTHLLPLLAERGLSDQAAGADSIFDRTYASHRSFSDAGCRKSPVNTLDCSHLLHRYECSRNSPPILPGNACANPIFRNAPRSRHRDDQHPPTCDDRRVIRQVQFRNRLRILSHPICPGSGTRPNHCRISVGNRGV